jgi:acyl-CoA synthetase (AMP-forming)/AMP-acid ligase II
MAVSPEQLRRDRTALRQRWYDEGHYGRRTFGQQLAHAAERYPRTAFVFASEDREVRLTMPRLHELSGLAAGGLRTLGVRPGDTVAIQVPNWPELVIAYYAAFLAGAVVVPITHIYGPSEMSFILRESGAKVLLVPERWRSIDYVDRVKRLENVPELETVVWIGGGPAGGVPWSALVEKHPAGFTAPELSADEVCTIIYTSGTTSAPKGVRHTHNTLLAEMRGNATTLHLREGEDSMLVPWPAGHVAGLIGICAPLVNGVSAVLMDRWEVSYAVRLIEKYRCGATSGTPLHFSALLDEAAATGRGISSLRFGIVGAANVPATLVERADAAGLVIARCYGSTEHPTVTSSDRVDSAHTRARTDGYPRFGNELKIIDENGDEVPVGVDGEIATRGPELFVGYRDVSLDEEAFLPGGWYLTGDIGRLDENGSMTVTDRRKDIIIRGGENIASKEVEDVLLRHPAVMEVAVVGAPDPRYGERVAAFVRVRDGETLSLAEVAEHFQRVGVARQKTPERLHVVAELPHTPSGKVQKFALRERLRACDQADPAV